MKMDKWLCAVIGENYTEFNDYHNDTKKRVRILGVLIHIPVLLWGYIGHQIATDIFNTSASISVITALVFGIVIYAVEFSIIQIKTSKFKDNWAQVVTAALTRFTLAILLATIGSYIIDFKIFKNEISAQLNDEYKIERNNAIRNKETSIKMLDDKEVVISDKIQKLTFEYINEGSGKGISGKEGNGPYTKIIQKRLKEMEDLLKDIKIENKIAKIQIHNDFKFDEAAAKERNRNPGLLSMKVSLDKYIESNNSAEILFWFIFTVMAIFEILVLLAKLLSIKTVDDQKSELQAELILEEAKTRMEIRSKKLTLVRTTYDPRLEKAQAILQAI